MQITDIPSPDKPIIISGPAGALEAMITLPAAGTPAKAIGIVCHPHSLYGGSMKNKVVTTLARVFKDLGAVVIRFNFRGVGASEGAFDHGIGETDDLLAVIQWAQLAYPDHDLWLAGFSFGSYVAARTAAFLHAKITKLVLVAPAVNHFDFAALPPFSCPTWVVQGDQDEVVPAAEVYDWIKHRTPPPELLRFPDATHFFHGKLKELQSELIRVLR